MVDEVSVPRFTEEDDFPATVPMLQNGWPPTGGPINIAADQGLLNWPLRELTNRTRHLKNRLDEMAVRAGALVTVGPGGDYPSINLALSELSERRPAYTPGGFVTEVRLLAGFTMAEQVLVSGLNLGWITLTSDSPEVLIDRAYLTTLFAGGYPAFGAANGGTLPTINVLFNMMANGVATQRDGIAVSDGGFVRVGPGGGVRNAGRTGLRLVTSGTGSANNAIFTNAGEDAVSAAGGTRVSLQQATLTGAIRYGLRAVNSASANAWQANCSGAGNAGIWCNSAANIDASETNCSGCVTYGIYADGNSTIAANGANARRGGSDSSTDFVVAGGSRISANGGTGGTNVTVNTVTAAGQISR